MLSKKIFLVTGPPGNGRDEYIINVLSEFEKVVKLGYYHVFEYMQRVAPEHGIPNLTRENVFDISKTTLERIRDSAFEKVCIDIEKSDNDIEIVSTPATFRVSPWGNYLSGRVDGINISHLKLIKPNFIIVFIDDLLRVREKLMADPLWSRMGINLRYLAEWRRLSIEILKEYYETSFQELGWIIFAKEHPINTFKDIILNIKPKIYLSYHITGYEDFKDIRSFIDKLSSEFICIDPYAIKDWDIVREYDKTLQVSNEGDIPEKIDITINYREGPQTFHEIPLAEIEDAIDLIRTQIVDRDFQLIASVHATVVYHKDFKPSYGVMAEIIHSVMNVSRPVYVLYPFKIRPSPFFEHFIKRGNMIHGNRKIEDLENELISKLKSDYRNWATWTPPSASA